jgi:hypothetical protein
VASFFCFVLPLEDKNRWFDKLAPASLDARGAPKG